jgi:hypothetical protein
MVGTQTTTQTASTIQVQIDTMDSHRRDIDLRAEAPVCWRTAGPAGAA